MRDDIKLSDSLREALNVSTLLEILDEGNTPLHTANADVIVSTLLEILAYQFCVLKTT